MIRQEHFADPSSQRSQEHHQRGRTEMDRRLLGVNFNRFFGKIDYQFASFKDEPGMIITGLDKVIRHHR